MAKIAKNGKIEFARFGFSVIIMIFHIFESILPPKFRIAGVFTAFADGWIGVEFFFVVSGYLMAATAFKKQSAPLIVGKETANFLGRKLMAVLPYHLIIFPISFIYVCVTNFDGVIDIVRVFVETLPNFLYIQRSGLKIKDVLGVEWYISEMLIAMLILYPLCRKYYERFTRTIAPVLSLMIIGYLIKTTGTLGGSTAWSVIFSKTFLRAFSEICAGVFVFEACRNFKKLNFSKMDKIFLTLLEVFSYAMILLFVVYKFPGSYSGTFFIFICLAVMLSFSDVTYGAKLFNNKVVYYLGSLSLPLYLCQSLMRSFAVGLYKEGLDFWLTVTLFMVSTFVYAFIARFVEKYVRCALNSKISKLTRH